MHKYFVDAELNSMLGSTYDNSEYSETKYSPFYEYLHFLFIYYRLNFNTYYVKQLEKFCSDDKLLEAEKKQSAS
ncbi:hypothetical protein HF086_011720 [Spodoptera exigua]|uniref:Uncharacterized protein n=1 Tax=Spodoptera exigua TaxID=7107 RepID=A0A922MTF0_SPOEX|nr:hypothetical protein HF086_011720 [Spodoptera exigua]